MGPSCKECKNGNYPVEDFVITLLSEKYDSCTSFRGFLQYPLIIENLIIICRYTPPSIPMYWNYYDILTKRLPHYKYCLLHVIAYSGLANVFAHLLKSSKYDIHVNAGVDSSSPLSISAKHGYTELLLQLLLKHGAEVNSQDNTCRTPLSIVARYGHTAAVRLLLKHDIDVNSRDRLGYTALDLAAQYDHTEILKVLLEGGADLNTMTSDKYVVDRPLHFAVQRPNIEAIKLLLDHPDIPVDAGCPPNDTPLCLLIKQTPIDVEALELLVDKGAEVNLTLHDYSTPLQWAAKACDPKAVKVLLDAGAKVNCTSPSSSSPRELASWSPLALAISLPLALATTWPSRNCNATDIHRRETVVQLLLQHGAALEVTGIYGATPLYKAAWGHYHVVLSYLLEHGVNVNAKDKSGKTPLMAAINAYWPFEVTEMEMFAKTLQLILAQKDVDVNWKVDDGSTALSRAERLGQPWVIELLKAHGAVDQQKEEKYTR
jgi:ankyrin repeat protein